jgi:hypothetical protein
MGTKPGRALLTGGLAVALATGVGVVASGPAYAAPATEFRMPFPCGQEWAGSTRASHSPSSKAVDWNRPDDLGDQVVSAAPGVVTTAEPKGKSGYGHYVRVEHVNGENTIYAHLTTVVVKVGQRLDQGALLGTVGETGNATGPHLHFEERSSSGVIAPFFDAVKFVFGRTQASRNCVDVPVAGNLLAGPAAEVAVFRRATAAIFRVNRPNKAPKVFKLGTGTDQPVVGDWDGDGRANIGVRTPATKTFQLQTPAGVSTIVFGTVADQPIAGDWDGDGLWEVGVLKAGTNVFRLRAADGSVSQVALGDADDLPVTGDWDGDKATDLGVYDSATAVFTLRIVDADGLAWTAQVPFGEPGDLPVTGDWDANGRTDVGVWNPGTATFSQRRAKSPVTEKVVPVRQIQFGNPR